ncbi:bacteriocin biosynthesis cyclodehydratase domain-containing protein [Paraoerskovia marina]|uniref:Bacteriocin biosynthesis cyclodehydratase domain-containing protein n=2 Tax=Paraoerskovia marina TaxID=545619 RepID=A0A1H1UWM0_9CELL|nr:bacteriocin biosynthesis cyclodehydratase domain-containing protein [Paraoerskovia marina]
MDDALTVPSACHGEDMAKETARQRQAVDHPSARRRHLRGGTLVVRCSPTDVQLGTDARWAVRLSDVTENEIAWLRALAAGGRYSAALHRTHRVDELRARQLWQALDAAGYTVPAPPADGSWPLNDEFAHSHLREDGRGDLTLADRRQRCVAIHGLGRLGLATGRILHTAGVGTLLLDDARPVTRLDLAPDAYSPEHLGRPRDQVARHLLGLGAAGRPSGRSARVPAPDVVVVVEAWAHDARRFARLCAEGVPHLAVQVHEASTTIGPFVVPGRTPCLRCLDLARLAADPRWRDVAAHLHALPPGRTGEETTITATAAALAAAQVISALDGGRPRTADTVLETGLPDVVPRVRPTSPHPGCGCGADGATPGLDDAKGDVAVPGPMPLHAAS